MGIKIPIWKRSCIDNLRLDDIVEDVNEMSEIEWKYENHSRKEEFQIFFCDISAKAEQLSDMLYTYRDSFEETDGFMGWDDLCVVLFGGARRVLGFDVDEMDYYSLFERGWGNEPAVNEAKKRLSRLTKDELVSRHQKAVAILAAYFDLKAAYDALTSALDFLENDGLKKSEELTREVEYRYGQLQFYEGRAIECGEEHTAFVSACDKAFGERHRAWVE